MGEVINTYITRQVYAEPLPGRIAWEKSLPLSLSTLKAEMTWFIKRKRAMKA